MTNPAEPHAELAELAWIEALGALDASDRARLAVHLREGCPACLDALHGGSEIVAKLAHLFAPAQPSDLLRARIARASERRSPAAGAEQRRPPRRVRLASAASWVALGIAALLGFDAWREARSLRGELERERTAREDAGRELAQSESRAQSLAREHAELSELLAAVAAREARSLALTGEAEARASAFVANERVVLFVHGLPQAPPGMTYQAWTIEGGVPRSAGVFEPDESGSARHRARLATPVSSDAVIAVTLEPDGGVPQPTGAIVLASR